MKKEVGISFFIVLFLVIGIASAQTAPNRLACILESSTYCSSGTPIMRLSADTNAHGQIIGQTPEYGYTLCCGDIDSQGGPITGLSDTCSGLHDNVLELSADTNAHGYLPGGFLSTSVCISVSGNPTVIGVDCTSGSGSCPTGYATLVSLSANTNAHLAVSTGTGSYDTKICCRVNMDDTPPVVKDMSVIYGIEDFYNSLSDYSVSVDPGTDPETGISSSKLFVKTAALDGSGNCGTFSGWSFQASGGTTSTSITVPVTTGTCYMFNYSSTNGAELTSYVTSTNILKVDRVRPITTDTYTEMTYGNDVSIPLVCRDDDGSGCAKTEYCIYDHTVPPVYCTDFIETTDLTVIVTCDSKACDKVVRYRSIDVAGNTEQFQYTGIVHINTSLPWCKFTAPDPTEGQYINDPDITLEWEGGDPGYSGIDNYEIIYSICDSSDNCGGYNTLAEGTQTIYNRNFGPVDQKYNFQCIVTNGDNEIGYSGVLSLSVDSNAPTASVTAPEWSKEKNFSIEWEGDDSSGSGIDDFEIQDYISTWSLWNTFTTADSAEYEFQTGDDTVKFRIRATDKASNTGEWTDEVTTRLDTKLPVCTISALDEYQTHNTFPVSWTGSDLWDGDGSTTELGGEISYAVDYSTDEDDW
ncbi:MAG: hypothetical protein JRI49_07560, partial [Deltaproteobacteria bacterium]|nr:hypothetical protein [Deltaproteobacteria bacterium]